MELTRTCYLQYPRPLIPTTFRHQITPKPNSMRTISAVSTTRMAVKARVGGGGSVGGEVGSAEAETAVVENVTKRFQVSEGCSTPLGATLIDGGVNFAIFSSNAFSATLCLITLSDLEQFLKEKLMAFSQARDFMFCNLCGTMLSLISPKYAECSLCKSKTSAKGILDREIGYTLTSQDIQRDLGISHAMEEMTTTKESAALIKQTCKSCGNTELEYTTRQMRSADEGQTVFLVCPKCKARDTEN